MVQERGADSLMLKKGAFLIPIVLLVLGGYTLASSLMAAGDVHLLVGADVPRRIGMMLGFVVTLGGGVILLELVASVRRAK